MGTFSDLKPLTIKNKLADTPQNEPKYKLSIKAKSGEEETLADPRATRALVALMNQHATIGGAACHWGGPAAFAEIMSSTHAIMFRENHKQWHEQYNFINDAGHAENGIYALRANYNFDNLNFNSLRGFRSIESKLTGHGEGHLNPEGVFISNGPLGSGVPQAQGLALADKIIGNDRVTVCAVSDGASMEGEAKESFCAIPGLASMGKLNPFVMLISDNNTKLSGRIDQDSFNMVPTFDSLATLGWKVIFVEDGHNLQTVHNAIETAIITAKENPKQPIAIHFKTIKGFGVKSTEESKSGGHGYPLKAYDTKLVDFVNEIYAGNAPEEFTKWAQEILDAKPSESTDKSNSTVKEKVQVGFARALNRATSEGLPVFSVTSDLQGSTGIAGFHKEHPGNYVDLGVAESNMVSTAIGLAKAGIIPIVDTFAQFGVTKGNLPFIMSALSEGPVIALFSHTGFQDAADGASHQATTYLSSVCSIPNTTIVTVSCSSEAETYMYEALTNYKKDIDSGKTPNSVIFFLGRETHPPKYSESVEYTWKKPQVLCEGKDVTIVSCGPLVPKALLAAKELEKQGKSATVINSPFINHPDTKIIGEHINKTAGKLITLEDHQVIGGMGSLLCHALIQDGYSFKTKALGIPGVFGQSAYKADQLYAKYGIDENGVLEAFKNL